MSLPTPQDVAVAVVAAFTGSPACKRALPGGLWYGRVREDAPAPYAVLAVAAEKPQRLGGGRCLRAVSVRISIYGDTGPADTRPAASALEALMAGLVGKGSPRWVDARPDSAELDVQDQLRAATDVTLAALQWRATLEG